MLKFPFHWVDAFTSVPYGGNPCAVLLGAHGLPDETMLKIAREMNLSETAFVGRAADADADFEARYFTPEREIPLAGHPTIASVHVLLEAGLLPLDARGEASIRLRLPAGIVRVRARREAGERVSVVMEQLTPKFLRTYDPETVGPVFGLEARDFFAGAKPETVSTGSPMLMVLLKNQEALRKVEMDVAAYKKFRAEGDFFSPHFFCLGGATAAGQTFARHFGVFPDTLEDPFTGSATGAMAAYLWKHGLIAQPKFVAEQGHWLGRPGSADVEVVGPPGAIETVRVTGLAATIVRGEIAV